VNCNCSPSNLILLLTAAGRKFNSKYWIAKNDIFFAYKFCKSPQRIEGQIGKRKRCHFLHSITVECKKWHRFPNSERIEFAPRRGERQICPHNCRGELQILKKLKLKCAVFVLRRHKFGTTQNRHRRTGSGFEEGL
jgi:hypothetical protein